MFICKLCLGKYDLIYCFFGSFEKCELCGKTSLCESVSDDAHLVFKKKDKD
jgi:hypothetical protein